MKKIATFIICLITITVAKADILKTPLNKTTADTGGVTSPVVEARTTHDTTFVPAVTIVSSYQNVAFKRRLDSIKREVPLDYNDYVQTYIDIYTAPGRKEEMAHILGLTKYYFPIYEKAFRDAGIPEEIKYLSVVESALDPMAVSRVGATGPWQFMFATGKLYGLNIDNYVDERRDPIQATYAAAAYIKDAYLDFGDWLVAIASYNCGKGAVTRAIEKAGASDFWSIRPYLPAETRNYVPAYIAIAYVMNFYNHHGIMPRACEMALKTDTILVNKYVSLYDVSRVLSMDIKQISGLNPQYKMQIINGTDAAPKRLVIPKIDKANYTQLYDALNNSNLSAAQFAPVMASVNETSAFKKRPEAADAPKKSGRSFITYKVRRGDTLSQIADKFDGATVEQIKTLNGLKGGKLQPGMTLKITKG